MDGKADSHPDRKRVVVFEPDADVLIVLMRVLARVDAEVEPMSELSEAEQLFLERPPDVLLIDLWPGRSVDLELARTLKLTTPGAKVVLLAREQVDRSSVADAVVAVPFSPSRLFDVISALVQGPPL